MWRRCSCYLNWLQFGHQVNQSLSLAGFVVAEMKQGTCSCAGSLNPQDAGGLDGERRVPRWLPSK